MRMAKFSVYEAVELRLAGVKSELLVIGGVPPHLLEAVVKYDLQMNLFEALTAKCLHNIAFKAGKKIKVHIKIETGMNRLGVRGGKTLDELLDFIEKLETIEIVGVYTHFATSTEGYYEPFAIQQFEEFKRAVEQIRRRGIKLSHILLQLGGNCVV